MIILIISKVLNKMIPKVKKICLNQPIVEKLLIPRSYTIICKIAMMIHPMYTCVTFRTMVRPGRFRCFTLDAKLI